ncbi:hypothetical protein O3M35_001845 [Rhynocoris fuscipes]|uniref:Elongation of very long chain fatty acids protein n=1 Tax=Rhynocoris fuscipes TaxID=488301 RepID=A0AAW1CVJ1_9HEMI
MAELEIMKYSIADENEFLLSPADRVVDDWPMMSNPAPVLLLTGFYLYFVLSLGPKLMEHRKPFDLKYVMIVYNFCQVVFSAWLCSKLFSSFSVLTYIYTHACSPMPRHNNPMIILLNTASWWYFMSKVVELLDTLFFVLRKKQNQVTVLHVYHHAIMVISTWGYLKYARGEQGIIPGFLNSVVHVIMYSYYLLAALGPRVQKYLWWKKYLTKLQLGQFVLILLYLSTMIILDCQVPRGLTLYMSFNTFIFLILFINFYKKSYSKGTKPSLMNTCHLQPINSNEKND